MDMKEPLFSIITATYNAADTVGRTLASVDAQTFADYEHIVVDGASADGTTDLVAGAENPARRMISEPDKGLYDAMNKGIAAATGQYLIFLNAGDKFHSPDTLQLLADTVAREGTPGIVYGQTLIVDDAGRTVGERHLRAPAELTLKSFASGMLVCHQAFVPLRRIAGFYNLKYRYSADYEWCIRCLQHSRKNVGLTDTYLVDYLSEGLTTRHRLPSLMERFRIMAYYYGFFSTVGRHFGFVVRALRRRLKH